MSQNLPEPIRPATDRAQALARLRDAGGPWRDLAHDWQGVAKVTTGLKDEDDTEADVKTVFMVAQLFTGDTPGQVFRKAAEWFDAAGPKVEPSATHLARVPSNVAGLEEYALNVVVSVADHAGEHTGTTHHASPAERPFNTTASPAENEGDWRAAETAAHAGAASQN